MPNVDTRSTCKTRIKTRIKTCVKNCATSRNSKCTACVTIKQSLFVGPFYSLPDFMTQDPNRPPAESASTKKPNAGIEIVKTLGLSLCLAFGIRAAVAQSFFIPSGSMEPTLKIDDRLMVDKLSYRFQTPQRGDIIVFSPPQEATEKCNLASDFHDVFIKRVIGAPGDRVEIKNGTTYINDQATTESYRAAPPAYDWGPQTVPEGSYFVLGDNRNSSCDGHLWGFVPRDHIVGRAVVRFWPLDRMGGLGNAKATE
jgi:signal peptidase I